MGKIKFDEIKNFPQWLQWKKESRKWINIIFVAYLLIVFSAVAYILGWSESYNIIDNLAEEASCSAIGMEHVNRTYNDYCVDEQGNFYEIIIKNKKAYIENNPQGGIVNEGIRKTARPN